MQDSEKVYRIELTNEEYEFLENLKTEFCNKLSKMSNEEITEYLKSFYPEQNLNFEKEIKGTVYKVNTYFNKDAEDNKQEIDIYYRGVDIISFPVSLEDMTMVIEKMINKKISA